jgi:hypothetical protein
MRECVDSEDFDLTGLLRSTLGIHEAYTSTRTVYM